MNKTDGSIVEGQTEEVLLTYSEEEKQQQEINEANAKLVFSPEFIPFYPAIKRRYSLTETETLLYGFIRFYMGSGENKRFYFTNAQLSQVLGCSEVSVKRSMKTLSDKGIIKTSHKVKAGGGTIRFISDGIKMTSPTGQNDTFGRYQNDTTNNNKINDNKIKDTLSTNVDKGNTSLKTFGNEDINLVITTFEQSFGKLPRQQMNRYAAKRLIKGKGLQRVVKAIEFAKLNRDDRYCPSIASILDLEQKWIDLETYARRAINGLRGGVNNKHYDATTKPQGDRLADPYRKTTNPLITG